jgi:hypothetical protein
VTVWVAPRAHLLRVLSAVVIGLIFAFWPYRTRRGELADRDLAVVLFVIQFLGIPARSPMETGDTGEKAAPGGPGFERSMPSVTVALARGLDGFPGSNQRSSSVSWRADRKAGQAFCAQ